ncbi:MAG: response regulator [Desulfobacterales bacterium]|nr:response regulator [Desulfobacterales bacterium]
MDKMKIFFQSFKFKVFTLFFVFIFVISLSFTTLLFLDQSKLLTNTLINNGHLINGLLGHSSKIGIFANNKRMLKNPVEGVLNQKDVIEVAVFGINGKLIERKNNNEKFNVSNYPASIFNQLKEQKKAFHIEKKEFFEFWSVVESKTEYSLNDPFFHTDKPPEKNVIGFVQVIITKNTLKKKLNTLLLQCIVIAILFITCGSFILYYSVNKITKPLNRLTKEVRAIGRSDKVEIIPVKTKDEFGNLTEAFNEMYTSLEQRKTALAKSEEKFNQFFNDDLAGAFIADLEGNIIDCNPSFATLLGYSSPSEAIHFNIETFYRNQAYWSDILENLSSKKKQGPYDSVMIHRDGSSIFIVENTIGIFNEDELVEVKGYIIDVTKQKNLEDQLRQSQKMEAIGTLAGGIAHDFNNILYPIMGYTEMALDDLKKDSDLHSNMEEILKASKRAKDLVLQILAFSHKSEQEKKPIKIQYVLKEALKLLRASIPATIDIIQTIENDCGFVLADSTQIHQIVMNLCTNAFHAMEDSGGTLKVSLVMEKNIEFSGIISKEVLVLTVEDTGVGIESSIIERIFDPYFTTKEFGKGTGLGLAVAHGIVKSSGGEISINSTIGVGTKVRIIFPVIKEPDSFYEIIPDIVSFGKENVLIVDDEEQIAEMTRKQLVKVGYSVTVFTDSLKAFDHFSHNRNKYQLILTDQVMKDLTGIQFSKKIFQITPDIPIIMCTGFANLSVEKEAIEIGIKKVIQKPIHRNLLSTVIRDALNNK